MYEEIETRYGVRKRSGNVGTKKGNDIVFDITPNVLNRYINSIVPGATAKTFGTCHASKLMEENLRKRE